MPDGSNEMQIINEKAVGQLLLLTYKLTHIIYHVFKNLLDIVHDLLIFFLNSSLFAPGGCATNKRPVLFDFLFPLSNVVDPRLR